MNAEKAKGPDSHPFSPVFQSLRISATGITPGRIHKIIQSLHPIRMTTLLVVQNAGGVPAAEASGEDFTRKFFI